MLADQHRTKPSSTSCWRVRATVIDAGIEGSGNFAVTPSFACLRGIRLQQDACLGQLSGRVFPHTYQRVEPFPLLIAELHHVPLLGNLFRGYQASPSLRS